MLPNVYFVQQLLSLLGNALKHLRCLLENPFWKTDDGIDHKKSNRPEQQHGEDKESETVFHKIDCFGAAFRGKNNIASAPVQRLSRELFRPEALNVVTLGPLKKPRLRDL